MFDSFTDTVFEALMYNLYIHATAAVVLGIVANIYICIYTYIYIHIYIYIYTYT